MGMVGDNGYEEVNRKGHVWPCKGGGDRHEGRASMVMGIRRTMSLAWRLMHGMIPHGA